MVQSTGNSYQLKFMDDHQQRKIIYDVWLIWTITNTCNLNCTYCNASDPGRIIKKFYDLGFLNSARIVGVNLGKLIGQMVKQGPLSAFKETKAKLTHTISADIDIPALMRTFDASKKVFKISFTGGEPFLVPNFIEACKAITKENYITIFSNLTSPDIKTFSETVDPRKVLEICGSLHVKELERLHLLERYIENFTLLEEKGFNIKAQAVAYPNFSREVETYRSFFKKKGVDVEFVPFRGRYRWKQYPKSYTGQEIKIFEFGASQKSHTDIMNCFYQKRKICNAGYNAGVVFPSGDAQTCFMIGQSMGNVFTEIEFNKNLITCPFKYCSCPLNIYDPSLFEKACHENK
ncbi:MAG TPA: radical SAM protein [Smithellaceae bacterium]|nr:radical SAM protein [Smithellaceae bacterium]